MLVVFEPEQLPVAAARAGDADAWNTLFKRYQLPLYTYVFELLHDEQASLDVVQETFINAARHIGGLRHDDKFGSWLFGIAHQKCIQRWRKPRRDEIPIDESGGDYPDSADDPGEYANLASIACALERYRLARGQFPDSLDSLAPKFIRAVPRDVIMDQPLKYRRADDGQFILYSVGWNKKDDNGAVVKDDMENTKGDWAWKYPAPSRAE